MLPLLLSLLLTYKFFWKDLIRIRKQLIQPELLMETRCLVAGSCFFFFFLCYFPGSAIDWSEEAQFFGTKRVPFTLRSFHFWGRRKTRAVCTILAKMDTADLGMFQKSKSCFMIFGIATAVKKEVEFLINSFFKK
jgi:hypothetical protein